MASNTLPGTRFESSDELPYLQRDGVTLGNSLARLVAPLASLRLTVVLLAMAIFLIFAGTLAQTEKDIWEVVNQYFRTTIAWIDLQIFFPKSFYEDGKAPTVPGSFPYPGGFLIGTAMAVNLLAAHGLRFKIQARGSRLAAGLTTIAAGVALTWLVVVLGPDKQGFEGSSNANWSVLWTFFRLGLAGLCVLTGYAFWSADRSQKIERAGLGILGIGLAALLITILALGEQAAPGGASMRILWQLMKGGTAGLVLLAGCILVFRKRAGIVLLHAGIGLMMANELVVYGLHSEGQMQVAEGQTVDYAQDIRAVELSISDPSDAKYDDVVVIPRSQLQDHGTIRHDDLPFDVELIKYVKNADLVSTDKMPDEDKSQNPATAGSGLHLAIRAARPAAGTDTGGKVDLAAAYVRFLKKGTDESLGTYLLAVELKPQTVEVAGKPYDVSLRFKRDYKPYSVFLYHIAAKNHLGTPDAQSYTSTIRLVDSSHNVDRKLDIWMNNPLRYSGETFYQSGYIKKETAGEETTSLQVVSNAGWMIPYVGCMIVAIGLFAQFSQTLLRFLNRRNEEEARARARAERTRGFGGRSSAAIWVPLFTVMLAVAWIGAAAWYGWDAFNHVQRSPMDLYAFGKLPVHSQGRIKPFDTLARNSLCILSDRETFDAPVEDGAKAEPEDKSKNEETKPQTAIRWLLDVIARPAEARKYKIFRIQNLDVLQTLGLEPRKGWRYSQDELRPRITEFEAQVKTAEKAAKTGSLNAYQRKLLELDKKIELYMQLSLTFDPYRIPEGEEDRVALLFEQLRAPLAIPALGDSTDQDAAKQEAPWSSFAVALLDAIRDHQDHKPLNPATLAMSKILVAYKNGKVQDFNKEVADYQALLAKHPPQNFNSVRTDFEAYFNFFNPFAYALIFYVIAFLLAAFSWLGWSRPFNRASFWLVVCAFGLHTFALVSRIYISGRPPVTNLYSSAIFIGWACVVLGLVLEVMYRMGIGNLVASVTGFGTLLIAYFLAADGDTFHVLEAVLDTQFWLTTHVTCVTLGYATTFLAGMLGAMYVLGGVLTSALSPDLRRALGRMIYGVLCFAMFFSFVGTVLGGLWADDSWGRFWGWDPKENGALIIVLWNALVLHARWGGMVKERGLATLAVVGNIVTSWSWFGVNALGIGLHSYGFKEGVLLALGIFVLSQLAVVALGCLPKRYWRSSREVLEPA